MMLLGEGAEESGGQGRKEMRPVSMSPLPALSPAVDVVASCNDTKAHKRYRSCYSSR